MVLIPLQDIGAAAALLAPFVVAGVQMLKAVGLGGSRLKSLAAVLLGQVSLVHWYVAWDKTPESLFLAVLVGVVASAIAMGLWAKALKPVVEGVPADHQEVVS